jgi:hypothetical protein
METIQFFTIFMLKGLFYIETCNNPLGIGIVVVRQLQHLPGSGLTLGNSS